MGKHYDDADVMRIAIKEPLTPEEALAVTSLKLAGDRLHGIISQLPASRETSIAKTKLEEAVMWAVKGLTS